MAGSALAQDPARDLFEKGWEDMEARRFDAACAKFEESYKLSGAAPAIQSVGECELQRGNFAASYNAYARARALTQPSDPAYAKLQGKLVELTPKVGRLVVGVIPSLPQGASLTVDGAPLQPNEERAFTPGTHTVELVGRPTPNKRQVALAAGEKTNIEMNVVVQSNPDQGPGPGPGPGPGEPQPAEQDHTLRTAGFIVGGVGVASLAVAIGTGFPVMNLAECNDGCDPSGDEDRKSEYDTFAVVNGIAWGVAIAGIGVGATLIIVDAVGSSSEGSAPTVALTVSPGFVGVSGQF